MPIRDTNLPDLSQVSKDDIVERSLSHLRKADGDYGDRVLKDVMERPAKR